MVVKTERRGSAAGLWTRLREALTARRRAREEAEDAWLAKEAERAIEEGGEPIPWEQVKRKAGLT
jgi:hypothetical protein